MQRQNDTDSGRNGKEWRRVMKVLLRKNGGRMVGRLSMASFRPSQIVKLNSIVVGFVCIRKVCL